METPAEGQQIVTVENISPSNYDGSVSCALEEMLNDTEDEPVASTPVTGETDGACTWAGEGFGEHDILDVSP